MEDLLDRLAEEPRDAEGEGERRVVLAGLDGVHRLARDLQMVGQLGLTPVALGAEVFQAVVHRAT